KLRAALVLHGKLGGIDRGQGWTRAVDGAEPTIDLAVICYAGATRHIVEANRAEAAIDIFGHSWSPEIGQALDALWQPRASVHEAEPRARNRQLCLTVGKMLHDATSDGSGVHGAPFAGFGGVGRGANSCERTANHLLGIQRAIQLKAKHEGRHGFKYDVVLVSRWDVLWSRPLILSRLDLSQHAFTVPTFCTHARGVDRQSDVEKQLSAFRKLACGGESSAGQLPTAATACHPSHRPCQPDLSPRAREFYLLDWWFASDSTAADDFGTVADEKLYANYTLLNQEHLNSARNSRPTIMGHAYWGLHMVWGLRAPLRFDGMVGHDFSLGRAYERSGCRAMRPNCAEDSCTAADVLARPWHKERGGLPTMPARPAPTYAYGGEQTRRSCGEGYFTCSKRSRMCKEEEEAWEPMDRDVTRRAWIACTAGICARAGAHKYSARCAGAVLGAWTAVWRNSPAADGNHSAVLRDAGYHEGTALGWTDPAHAQAALAELSALATTLYKSASALGSAPPTVSLKTLLTECNNPMAALANKKGKAGGTGMVA
ncbi:hypothetical protein Ctob_004102, partial [Chrysochromulina tobinii]